MASCTFCPRRCGIDRAALPGFCRETDTIRVAWAGLHFGEEPPITACNGSGTIFLTGCNLRCAFCQNYQISQEGMGAPLAEDGFAGLCLKLQSLGAENINIVTGSHQISSLVSALTLAKDMGLTIPVCWNSSGYETAEGIAMLKPVVDIWLPDCKTLDEAFAARAFGAPDYPNVARAAIAAMVEGLETRYATECNDQGEFTDKMVSGAIVRHLALPGRVEDTRNVLAWFDTHLAGHALLSLMTQYTPIHKEDAVDSASSAAASCLDDRFLSHDEYDRLVDIIDQRDDDSGFYQELVQDSDWLPDFQRKTPFASELAKGVWHWKYGWLC